MALILCRFSPFSWMNHSRCNFFIKFLNSKRIAFRCELTKYLNLKWDGRTNERFFCRTQFKLGMHIFNDKINLHKMLFSFFLFVALVFSEEHHQLVKCWTTAAASSSTSSVKLSTIAPANNVDDGWLWRSLSSVHLFQHRVSEWMSKWMQFGAVVETMIQHYMWALPFGIHSKHRWMSKIWGRGKGVLLIETFSYSRLICPSCT